MDSNFQVKITADISELQSRLRAVEAVTEKFKQSMDQASSSVKNMEQNANRGRMVAFAFGQVIRDAGFFSQSFSLGILAISNNIPILIDQLALSIKFLQPFAGTLSLIGSLLTAGLTIWAYSTQSVKKYTDAVNEAKASAMANSMELKSLLKIAQDESNSLGVRQNAIDKLNEKYKDYNGNLTVANVNGEKNKKLSADLAAVMLLEAEAAAIAAQAQLVYSKSLAIKNLPAEELAGFWETLGYSISKAFSIDTTKPIDNMLKMSGSLSLNLFNMSKTAKSIFDNFSGARQEVTDINEAAKKGQVAQLDKEAKAFEERYDAIQKKIAEYMIGSGGKTNAYTDALKKLSNELKKIDSDTSLVFSEKNKALIGAYQNAIEALSLVGGKKAANAISGLRDSIFKLNQEIYKAEGNQLAVKLFNIKVSQDAKEATEAEKDAAEELTKQLEVGLYTIDPLYLRAIENTKLLAEAQKAQTESVTALSRVVGTELVNSFMTMMETGKFSFESIGQALLGMIKRLIAAAAAAALLSAILSPIFGKAGNTGFKDIFKIISGLNVGGGVSAAPSIGASSIGSISTSIANPVSSAMQQGVLETRISGNDLVILMNRASNNRNNYF